MHTQTADSSTHHKRPMSPFARTMFMLYGDMMKEQIAQLQEPRSEDLKEVEVLAIRDVKE